MIAQFTQRAFDQSRTRQIALRRRLPAENQRHYHACHAKDHTPGIHTRLNVSHNNVLTL
jgi:hypothetical protein